MKSGGGGNIHIQVRVMDPVKAPEKRDHMVQKMPNIQHKIHEGDREKNLDPQGGLNQVQYSQLVHFHIGCSAQYGCGKDQVNQDTVKERQRDVVYPAFDLGYGTGPVRNQNLQQKKEKKSSPEKQKSYHGLADIKHLVSPNPDKPEK